MEYPKFRKRATTIHLTFPVLPNTSSLQNHTNYPPNPAKKQKRNRSRQNRTPTRAAHRIAHRGTKNKNRKHRQVRKRLRADTNHVSSAAIAPVPSRPERSGAHWSPRKPRDRTGGDAARRGRGGADGRSPPLPRAARRSPRVGAIRARLRRRRAGSAGGGTVEGDRDERWAQGHSGAPGEKRRGGGGGGGGGKPTRLDSPRQPKKKWRITNQSISVRDARRNCSVRPPRPARPPGHHQRAVGSPPHLARVVRHFPKEAGGRKARERERERERKVAAGARRGLKAEVRERARPGGWWGKGGGSGFRTGMRDQSLG